MNPLNKAIGAIIRRLLPLLILFAGAGLVVRIMQGPSTAQSNPVDQGRKLKVKEFRDLPLVIREVRNLQSDTWHKDLEIEIKNVSSKPIYYILAYLHFPDVPVPGNGVWGLTFHYGYNDNILVSRIADPKDQHLDPGETVVFTIPEHFRKGLKRKYEESPDLMKKIELYFGVISFGDGTGFEAERFGDHRLKKSHAN